MLHRQNGHGRRTGGWQRRRWFEFPARWRGGTPPPGNRSCSLGRDHSDPEGINQIDGRDKHVHLVQLRPEILKREQALRSGTEGPSSNKWPSLSGRKGLPATPLLEDTRPGLPALP